MVRDGGLDAGLWVPGSVIECFEFPDVNKREHLSFLISLLSSGVEGGRGKH